MDIAPERGHVTRFPAVNRRGRWISLQVTVSSLTTSTLRETIVMMEPVES